MKFKLNMKEALYEQDIDEVHRSLLKLEASLISMDGVYKASLKVIQQLNEEVSDFGRVS